MKSYLNIHAESLPDISNKHVSNNLLVFLRRANQSDKNGDCLRRSGLPTTFKIMSDLPVHCKVCPIHQVFHFQILKTYLTTQLRCLEAEGEKNTKLN